MAMTEHVEITPFRFRELAGNLLITNEAGEYGAFEPGALDRLFSDNLTEEERTKLLDLSILIDPAAEWRLASLMRRVRHNTKKSEARLSYLIIVPTLRCDLSCSYCQVSRAPLDAPGFDWTEEQLIQFARFLDNVEGDRLKLEFQGGEPTLRPDLLRRIIDLCEARFSETQFVICTNLTRLTPEIEEIIARDDVIVSTSIDGPLTVMTSNRTGADDVSRAVLNHFHHIVRTYGSDKVSALPTITDAIIDDPKALIDCYVECGLHSIFLRPVNYQGFARKRYADLSREIDRWSAFYRQALSYIAELNKSGYFEEFYLALLVRSIFAGLPHGYVDFRSPARFGFGYCVIDFDGRIYPTDEARMLSRIGQIDLAIGDLQTGIDPAKLEELNLHAIHQVNQDCQHCVYMPYCGIDVVDDISRYGRIDVPKHETWFCNRQTMLFDLIFEKVIARDRPWIDMFSKWVFHSAAPAPAYELFHD